MQPWLELGNFKLGAEVEDYDPADPQVLKRRYKEIGTPTKPRLITRETRRVTMRFLLLMNIAARGKQITESMITDIATREIAPGTTFEEALALFEKFN